MFIYDFLFFALFLALIRFVPFFRLQGVPNWVQPFSFGLKALVGILFLTVYLHPNSHNQVPSDTMRFLSESKLLQQVFTESPSDYFRLLFGIGDDTALIDHYLQTTFLWDSGSSTIINDSRNIIRLHSVIQFISFESPFIHILFMCFISLMGIRNLYLAFHRYSKVNKTLFFLSLVLFPSALFWTSGILKEPILLFGIGLLARALFYTDDRWKKVIYGLIAFLLLLAVKPYVLACLVPAVAFYQLYKTLARQKLILSLTLFFALIVAATFLFKNKTQIAVSYLSKKQADFNHIGKGGLFVQADTSLLFFEPKDYGNLSIDNENWKVSLLHSSECTIVSSRNVYPPVPHFVKFDHQVWPINYYVKGALSYIETQPINNSLSQLIQNIPEAFVNAYARPFPLDPGSTLRFPAMLEVWILSGFLLYTLIRKRKLDAKTRGIVSSLLAFAILLFLLIGWTTPVIGAIFRYRFPAQLALLIVGLLLLEPLPLGLRFRQLLKVKEANDLLETNNRSIDASN